MSTRNCENWKDDETCLNVAKRIQKLVSDSRAYKAFQCGAWQISSVQCMHAIRRAILYAAEDHYKYTSSWYYDSVYKQAYAQCIQPILDQDNWPEIELPTILPPVMKRGLGDPLETGGEKLVRKKRGKDQHLQVQKLQS